MYNNDIIRRIRYTFDFSDSQMIRIFSQAGYTTTRAEISDWLKPDGDSERVDIYDEYLAFFLNGLIIEKRGKKEGEQHKPEKRLNNNLVLRKLKIALNFKDEDMLHILELTGKSISKHELSAFFRKPSHEKFRNCHDQILRNFIHGLQLKYRPQD